MSAGALQAHMLGKMLGLGPIKEYIALRNLGNGCI